MSELSKRWARDNKAYGESWVLKEKNRDWNRAHIFRSGAKWRLVVWEGRDWSAYINVETLRDAKALGRLLAAAAAANF